MSNAARCARTAAVIELLCDRFPQACNRGGPQPLKVGIYDDALAALDGAAAPRDLKSALRAYTSNARYLRALSAGACRVGLDAKPAGTVTPKAEAVAKKRLAESVNETTIPADFQPPQSSTAQGRRVCRCSGRARRCRPTPRFAICAPGLHEQRPLSARVINRSVPRVPRRLASRCHYRISCGACIILSTPLPRRGKTHQRARQHPSLDVHRMVHLEGNYALDAFSFLGFLGPKYLIFLAARRQSRGGDASCLAPSAQKRTCSFPGYGSHLG
jgi:ProP effector